MTTLRRAALVPLQYLARLGGLELRRPLPPNLDGTDRTLYAALSREPVRVILDIGANVGGVTARFATSFPSATIHAFEPAPAAFARLRELRGPRVFVTQSAVADREGIARMEIDGASTLNRISDTGVSVPVTTVDAYCGANGIAAIDILKSDTEGHELHVLRGARTMLPRTSFVLIEFGLDPKDHDHTDLADIFDVLRPLGFGLVNLFEVTYKPPSGAFLFGNALFYRRP